MIKLLSSFQSSIKMVVVKCIWTAFDISNQQCNEINQEYDVYGFERRGWDFDNNKVVVYNKENMQKIILPKQVLFGYALLFTYFYKNIISYLSHKENQ